MEQGFLEECLERGMSLDAIGELAGKHPSTVSYWLKKHGLEAAGARRHTAKGAVAREELERLVGEGLTLREMAGRLDRSVATIRHWLGRYGLKTAQAESRKPARLKKLTRSCRRQGMAVFVLEGRGYCRCTRCRAEAVARRRRVIKRKLVEEAGGRCVICGYSRCQQALQFHHLDPASKEFHVGHRGACRSLKKSRKEAKKCVLVCANCHAEVEAGLMELPVNCIERPFEVARAA